MIQQEVAPGRRRGVLSTSIKFRMILRSLWTRNFLEVIRHSHEVQIVVRRTSQMRRWTPNGRCAPGDHRMCLAQHLSDPRTGFSQTAFSSESDVSPEAFTIS